MIFIKNEIVRLTLDDSLMRILWVSPTGDKLVAINMLVKKCSPEWIDVEHWVALSEQGLAEPVSDDPFLRLAPEHSISTSGKARRDTAWAAIGPIVRLEPQIYYSDKRGRKIREVAQQLGIDKDTLRNQLRRYWQRGMSKNSLLPDYENCGNRGQNKAAGEKKRGRPRFDKTVGKNMDEQSLKYFEVAIANHFIGGKRNSFTDVYLLMLSRWYADDITLTYSDGSTYDGTKRKRRVLVLRNPDDVPTIEMFRYWYKKKRNIVVEAKARNGKKHFEKNQRSLLSNSIAEAICPGYRFQIDATILDVYIVSRANRQTVIGRPVLYLVVDVWSRSIVGFHIGIESPSWKVAMLSLLNAAEDKVEFCSRYGIDIEPNQWPQRGLNAVILGDRGEMESGMPEQLSNVLGIDLENTPPYRADLKGAVERKFRTTQAAYKPFVEGYIDVDYQQRGGHDYRLDATLDLYEITQQVIEVILMHNALPVTNYEMDVETINDEVLPSPNNLWTWGIENRQGHLHKKNPKLIEFAVLPIKKASVRSDGIHLFGRRYLSNYAEDRNWSTQARMGNSWRELVSYNPHNLDEIYLHNTFDRKKFEVCKLVTDDPLQLGLTVQEWLAVRRSQASVRRLHRAKSLEIKLTAQANMKDINDTAIRAKAALGIDERPKAKRVGEIQSNRSAELSAMQEAARNANKKPVPTTDVPNAVVVDDDDVEDFSLPPIFKLIKK